MSAIWEKVGKHFGECKSSWEIAGDIAADIAADIDSGVSRVLSNKEYIGYLVAESGTERISRQIERAEMTGVYAYWVDVSGGAVTECESWPSSTEDSDSDFRRHEWNFSGDSNGRRNHE